MDVISLDLYPDEDQSTINAMGSYVTNANSRYNKPVSVMEFGINTCTSCSTQTAQGQVITSSITSLKGGAGLIVAFIYEYKDNGTDQTDGEQTFGIVDFNNNKKSDYSAVMSAVQQANSGN